MITHSCETCEKVFKNKKSLKNHVAVKHDKTLKLKCDPCDREFAFKSTLKKHMKKYHEVQDKSDIENLENEQEFKCEPCNKIFKQKYGLQRHFAYFHSNEKPFKCLVCDGVSYALEYDLKLHFKIRHSGTRYKCEECPKDYAVKYDLH